MNVIDLSQWTTQDFSHLVTAAVVVLTMYATAWINRPHWSSTIRTLVAFGIASALTTLQLWGMGELTVHRLPWLVFVVFLSASVLYKTILRGSVKEFEAKTSKPKAISPDGSYTVTNLDPLSGPTRVAPNSIEGDGGAQVGQEDTTDGE
jgi:hypothetical protein